jgi:hypothetical protein
LPRDVAGVVGSALVAISVFLLASSIDRSLGLVIGSAVLALGVIVVASSHRGSVPAVVGFRQAAVTVALLSTAAPFLLYAFGHFSPERYLWVITLPGLCSHLGSAAVAFGSALIGWSMAAGWFGLLVATRRADAQLFPWRGTLLAGALIALIALIVAVAPDLAAFALGCAH